MINLRTRDFGFQEIKNTGTETEKSQKKGGNPLPLLMTLARVD